MIELVTPALRIVVDEKRGGQVVWAGVPEGPNALFAREWPDPVPASARSGYGSEALDWLSHYRGGWQVMFPNAGDGCEVDGVRTPIHGEVSATPAQVLERTPDRLRLASATRRPVRLERILSLDRERSTLLIEERAVNPSDRPLAVLWGHHPAFEAAPGARIDLPPGRLVVDATFDVPEADLEPGARAAWPRAPLRSGGHADLSVAPEGPVERVVYLPDRPAGWAAIRDRERGIGVGLAWDVAAFPHLWLWEQIGGARFPFFGRARIVALEPVGAWPSDGLAGAVERGMALRLGPGEAAAAWITLSLFEPDERSVGGVARDGRVTLKA